MAEEELRFKREILGVALLLSLGSIFVLYPFLDAIILAVATSYLLRFAHQALNSRINNETVSSIIIISSVLALLGLGIYFFINNFVDILSGLNTLTGSLRQGLVNIIEVLQLPESFKQNAVNVIDSISGRATDWLVDVFTKIPSLFIDLGIFVVTAIYLYKDGSKIESDISEVVENLPDNEKKIIKSLIRSMDSIFRGVFVTQFLVAAILGLVSGIGFYAISLVTSPMPLIPLWAFLIGIAALLPIVAAFMFYGPIGLFYMITGEPVKGSLIIVFGIIVLNILPEIFIRPYIGSRQMDEHPLIIFTGFIAGPLTLGLKGVILGPLLLILTKEFIQNYTNLVSSPPE
ncbi:MAG: AI-2E family transporter [Candidatus Nanohaloarchaea archaeon]